MFSHFMFFGKLFSTLFTGEWFHFQMGNINMHLKGWSFCKLFAAVFAKQSWSCGSRSFIIRKHLKFEFELPHSNVHISRNLTTDQKSSFISNPKMTYHSGFLHISQGNRNFYLWWEDFIFWICSFKHCGMWKVKFKFLIFSTFVCTSKMMVKLRFQAEFPVTFRARIIKFFFMNFQNMNLFPVLVF